METVKQDRFFHILRFVNFSNNKEEPHKTDENYDRLWKVRTIFDELHNSYPKYYSPTEHFDEIVLFKGRVTFKQYIPKKQSLGYTFIQQESVFRQRQEMCDWYNADAHANVTGPTTRTVNVGYKLYMDDFSLLPTYLMIYILKPKLAVVLSN
jgi:hypothetical protein